MGHELSIVAVAMLVLRRPWMGGQIADLLLHAESVAGPEVRE